MADVTALGEVLIDFTPCGVSGAGKNLFEQNPGGAPANVLAAISKMGLKTAFIGKVGEDMHGAFLRRTLEELQIDTSGMITDPSYFTTLAFVGLENGERSFSFARKPGADTQLRAEEIPVPLLRQTKIFHFGSLSLTDEPARGATIYAVEQAKKAGALISYDPNYRAPLWKDEASAMEEMRSVVPMTDIMKLSDEECVLLTGKPEPDQAAEALLERGVKAVFVTLGADGAMLKTKAIEVTVPGIPVKAVDTTGAGDSFWGAILTQFVKKNLAPETIGEETAREILQFANMTAALCVQKRGAIPAMPTQSEVETALAG
jgi:fructokinase